MSATIVSRNYNLTDAELITFTTSLVNYLTRDLSDFALYGLTAEKITQLKTSNQQFEVFPTDIVLQGDVILATDNKMYIRDQLSKILRSIAIRVEQKWGLHSGQYKRLDLRPLSNLTDDSLLVSARMVHSKIGEYLPELGPLGLTQAMIDELKTITDNFQIAKAAQSDAEAMRAEKRGERVNRTQGHIYD